MSRTSGQREVPVRGGRHGDYGGRCSKEAADVISSLAEAKVREVAPICILRLVETMDQDVGCFLQAAVHVSPHGWSRRASFGTVVM